jgi:hypothetical protein
MKKSFEKQRARSPVKGDAYMTDSTIPAERRQDKRIQIEGRADAVLFGPTSTKGIQVVDISKGGLAFRYVNGQKPSSGMFEIDILWDHIDFNLIKLRLRTVSDYQIPNGFLLGVIPVRRCGAQFVELTKDQVFQLEDFVENYRKAEKAS